MLIIDLYATFIPVATTETEQYQKTNKELHTSLICIQIVLALYM